MQEFNLSENCVYVYVKSEERKAKIGPHSNDSIVVRVVGGAIAPITIQLLLKNKSGRHRNLIFAGE